MDNVLTFFKKEFKSFFISPIAYVFITVYLVVTNFLFFQGFFIINQADMRGYFSLLPWVFLFFVLAGILAVLRWVLGLPLTDPLDRFPVSLRHVDPPSFIKHCGGSHFVGHFCRSGVLRGA